MDVNDASDLALDPWRDEITLDELAKAAAALGHAATAEQVPGRTGKPELNRAGFKAKAELLSEVLQARATLEAAENQRRTNRKLVWATWALVAVTIGVVVVTRSDSTPSPSSAATVVEVDTAAIVEAIERLCDGTATAEYVASLTDLSERTGRSVNDLKNDLDPTWEQVFDFCFETTEDE